MALEQNIWAERAPAQANAASVALIKDSKVLLIERTFAPFKGCWTLPGGRREPDENIEICARRELREELGLDVAALRPLRILEIDSMPEFRLAVFVTTAFSGTITPSSEIANWQWLELGETDGLPTTPDLAEVLRAAFEVNLSE